MSGRISRHQLAAYVVDQLAAGNQAVIKELAAYIVDQKLTRSLDLVVAEIEMEFASRGTVVADVTSARPLDTSLRHELTRFIASETKATTVELRERIDSELIGGVVIETPGTYFDSSLRGQLHQLKRYA